MSARGSALAETFADNPAVIAYDLLNEPFGDEVREIGPLYEDVAARIRKHDTKAILFIEPQACYILICSCTWLQIRLVPCSAQPCLVLPGLAWPLRSTCGDVALACISLGTSSRRSMPAAVAMCTCSSPTSPTMCWLLTTTARLANWVSSSRLMR